MMYVIPGDPIALMRARHLGTGRRPWDAQKKVKANIGIVLDSQHAGRPLYIGPLALKITFHFSMPKSHKGKSIGKYHPSPPDLSNLIKFVEDIAQSILYQNDCVISVIEARKVYSLESKTEFTIREIKDERFE